MKIKVCGMRQPANINAVAELGIDMMGFIFYDRSPRYVAMVERPLTDSLRARGIEPVALFVDEDIDKVAAITERSGFTTVQLHGSESPAYCDALRKRGIKVLKAISIACGDDIARAALYDGHADMLVIDTQCCGHGGSGHKFDWSLLEGAPFTTPFLLSGGIDADDAHRVMELYGKMHGLMAGVDVNSRFETEPGVKSPELLRHFINNLNTYDITNQI